MKRILFTAALIFLSMSVARAETKAVPVEISAAKSLEWNRKAKTYTAYEKVQVVQGAVKINSDILTARYNEDKGVTDITTLEAKQNVTIQSPPYTAYGDKAVYDVTTGVAVLTGKALKIVTPTETLTAKNKIEFNSAENRMLAEGDAQVIRGTDIIKADKLSGYFTKDTNGKMALSKVTAEGHVMITTSKGTVTGDSGVYDVLTQKAVLTNNVRMRQVKNWLVGARAIIDMKTGISQLLGGEQADGDDRVRGVFYPKAKKQE